MKKRILIPTDYSENAFNAIEYAMKLFENDSCEFFVVNSYYLSGFDRENLLVPKPSKAKQKEAGERSNQNMEKLKVKMKPFEQNKNHEFHYEVVFGPFFETMKNKVEKNKIELVVMGTQGESDEKSVILGSNSVNLMEKIRTCPILTIPAAVTFKKPNEIVFPTSFRTHYKEKELDILVDIAKLTQAPIRVLHIQNKRKLTKAQEKNKALLDDILSSAEVTQHRLFYIDVNDGVKAFVQSRESEMIAFVNKKHLFFGSIFSNPMAKELAMHTKVPLIAMHDKRV